jgi:TRAP-type C4-dicarboxylate transport system permease small subunit
MISGRPEHEIGSSRQAEGPVGPSESGLPDAILCPTLLERAMIWIGCACAILIFLLSLADIVLRAASVEFFLAGESNGILMAWMIFLALAYVTRTRSHLSLDFLDRLLPRWLRTTLRIFGYLVMLGYVAVLSWYCGKLVWSSYMNDVRSSSILRWPVVYAQLGVLVGLVLMAVTQLLILIADLRAGGHTQPLRNTTLS